jgi:hypothetical protein
MIEDMRCLNVRVCNLIDAAKGSRDAISNLIWDYQK